MKKLLPCALVAVFALSLVGCESKKEPPKDAGTTPPAGAAPAGDGKAPAKK